MAQILGTCFTISLWLTKLLSIRLEFFYISLKLVLKMSFEEIFPETS